MCLYTYVVYGAACKPIPFVYLGILLKRVIESIGYGYPNEFTHDNLNVLANGYQSAYNLIEVLSIMEGTMCKAISEALGFIGFVVLMMALLWSDVLAGLFS